MSRWFRVYDDLVDDPKVQRLSPDIFKALVNLWCLASQNNGALPAHDDIAFKLRVKPERVTQILSILGECGLIDSDETAIRPHNWDKRQFKSDVSNERVKRFRERHCNVTDTVTVTPPDTEQIQKQNTDTEKKDIRAVAKATRPDEPFENFWRVYPRRDGANPKAPARKKFFAVVKSGTDPAGIISAASRYSAEAKAKQQVGTPYVAQAVTWLNQQRWEDYPQYSGSVSAQSHQPPSADLPSDEELRRKYGAENGHGQSAGADEKADADGHSRQSGDAGELLGKGQGDDFADVPRERADHQTRTAGVRSLGQILRETPRLAAVGAESPTGGEYSGDDGSGAVARMV
jgi:hypothetical protein